MAFKNVGKIKEEYIDLNSFLIDRLNRGDLSYILCLLNGDDFYGKYLVRVLFNVETNFRCDAGVGKFSIDSNLDIYVCSWAVGDKKLCVGSLKNGIDFEKAKVIHDSSSINNQCSKCSFLKICGGECLVVKNINEKVNPQMCEIKQLLI